jgi:hypothetical protein
MEWAVRDLEEAFAGRSPAEVEAALVEAGTPAETAHATAENAAVIRIAVLAQTGRPARTAYEQAKARYGDTPSLARAEMNVLAGEKRFREAWARCDQALDRWPRDASVALAAAELTSFDPRGATPKARAAIARPADAVSRYNEAVAVLSKGDAAHCLAAVRPALPEAEPRDRQRFLALAHGCAAQAGELAAADAFLAELGGNATAAGALRHAELLVAAGRLGEARALLDPLPPETEGRDTLLLRLLVKEGDLDAALAIARLGRAAPETRANLALKLDGASRPADAAEVLRGACPGMTGEGAVRCYAMLGRLEEAGR